MITRRKAALLQALPLTDRTNEVSAVSVETNLKQKCDGVELPEFKELSRRMQVINLSSEESSDDDHEEESESDYSDENEASAISQSSEVSAMEDSSADEGGSLEDNEDAVVQPSKLPGCSIDSLVAEKVLQSIKEGDDNKNLTVDNCRSYLRHHGMRISGNKPVLIERIKQHIELKQGVPEKYGPATFTINCTGDVCKGDVIKFKQKVYESFSVQMRRAEAVGQRTVVGRVVKESYGEKKQQHTFTVEVLWSSGYKPLPPMHQLLVKGRNLYKHNTHRQVWEDERLRKISLDEKHERGDAARSKRRGYLRASGPRKSTVGRRKELPNPYVAMGTDPNSQRALRRGKVKHLIPIPYPRWFPAVPPVTGEENPVVPESAGSRESRQIADYRSAVISVLARQVANDRTPRPPAHKTESALNADAAASRSQDRTKEDFSTHKFSNGGLLEDERPSSKTEAVKGFRDSDGVPKSNRDTVPGEQSRSLGTGPAQYRREIQDRFDMDRSGNKSSISDVRTRHDLRADSRNSEIPSSSRGRDVRGSLLRLQSKIVSGANTCTDGKQKEVRPQWSDLRSGGQILPSQGVLPLPAQSSRIPSQRIDPFMDRGEKQASPLRKHSSFCRDSPAEVPTYRALSPGMPNRGVLREESCSASRRKEHRSPWRHQLDVLGGKGDFETGYPPLRQPWDQGAETRHNLSGCDRQNKHRRIDAGEVARRMQASPSLHQTVHVGAPLRQPWDRGDEACHNFPGSSRQNGNGRMDVGEGIRRVQGSPVRPASTGEQVKCLSGGCTNMGSVSCLLKMCGRCCARHELGQRCSNAKHRKLHHS